MTIEEIRALCHDDTIEIDTLGEGLDDIHDVLTSHGVNDHENLVRLNRSFDAFGLLHHVFIDVQATCRVDDGDIAEVLDGATQAVLRDRNGILAVLAFAVHAHADLAA